MTVKLLGMTREQWGVYRIKENTWRRPKGYPLLGEWDTLKANVATYNSIPGSMKTRAIGLSTEYVISREDMIVMLGHSLPAAQSKTQELTGQPWDKRQKEWEEARKIEDTLKLEARVGEGKLEKLPASVTGKVKESGMGIMLTVIAFVLFLWFLIRRRK
jgi:hypothetical protein